MSEMELRGREMTDKEMSSREKMNDRDERVSNNGWSLNRCFLDKRAKHRYCAAGCHCYNHFYDFNVCLGGCVFFSPNCYRSL